MAPQQITVRIPSQLRDCCAGARELKVSASSPGEVLSQLESLYPSLHRSVCDETGRVRRHIGLFVNSALVQDREALDTALSPGDVVSIFTAVSGG